MTTEENATVTIGEYKIDAEEYKKYQMLLKPLLEVDRHPKNILIESKVTDAYKRMCIDLAQGYEMDWVSFPYLIINEFGKTEHIDSFEKRHPNFAEDVSQALTRFTRNIN